MALMGFGDMDDMFGRMDRMMNSMMRGMFTGDPFGDPFSGAASMAPFGQQSYSMSSSPFGGGSTGYFSSSVTSMTTDHMGRPQVYQASNSQRLGPDGVRETRSSLRDSRTGVNQMAIGHHIRDRGHVVQRAKNSQTGEEEHNDEYINLEEEEAPQFEQEFNQRIRGHAAAVTHGRHGHAYHGSRHRSLPEAPRGNEPLAIAAAPHHPIDSSRHVSFPQTATTSRGAEAASRSSPGKESKKKKKDKKPYRK